METTVDVLSVLYETDLSAIERTIAALARSAEIAITGGSCDKVRIFYGDSSSAPRLTDETLASLRARYGAFLTIDYVFFNKNCGSAGGWNRLAEQSIAKYLLLLNPDVVVSPRLIEIMIPEFKDPHVGIVEAKQLPIEHPKDYDVHTGETSWAAMACVMIPNFLFQKVGGFDSSTFFLYCDDVDLSWRIRMNGYKIIFQPAACVFHDKRLTAEGRMMPSDAEIYYSAEAAILMAHKWSRPDLVEIIRTGLLQSPEPRHRLAVTTFDRLKESGRLPAPIDPDHAVGQFLDGNYTLHRYFL